MKWQIVEDLGEKVEVEVTKMMKGDLSLVPWKSVGV